MNKKYLILSILFVLITATTIISATYAFFAASASSTTDIKGSSYSYNMIASITNIVTSNKLIPTKSNLLTTSINSDNKCIDNDANNICSIYKVEIKNNGNDTILNGFLKTVTSSYKSDNLKYRLYTLGGTTYTLVSDDIVISKTADTNNYFKYNDTTVDIAIKKGETKTYYLVIWLNDNDEDQIEDINKTITGYFGFETTGGGMVKTNYIYN